MNFILIQIKWKLFYLKSKKFYVFIFSIYFLENGYFVIKNNIKNTYLKMYIDESTITDNFLEFEKIIEICKFKEKK